MAIYSIEGEHYDTITLMLYVTENCNLSCKYCFVKQEPRDMSLDTAKATIDFGIKRAQNVGAKKLLINFFGGEPLLKFELIKSIVEYTKSIKSPIEINFGITTNGTLLTRDIIDYFAENKFGILLSIDGNKKSHDTNRIYKDGKGSFDDIIKHIPYLLKKLPNTEARMSVLPNNVKEMYNSVVFLYKLGFRGIDPIVIQEGDWSTDSLNILRDELMKVSDFYIENIKNNRKIKIEFIDRFINKLIPRGYVPCGAGKGLFGISPEGDIYPCQEFYEFDKKKKKYLIGNVYSGIKNIDVLRFFRDIRIDNTNSKCYNCPLRSFCGIGCLAHNYMSTGDLFSPADNFCKIKKIEFMVGYRTYKNLLTFEQGKNKIRQVLTFGGIINPPIHKHNTITVPLSKLNEIRPDNNSIFLISFTEENIKDPVKSAQIIENFIKKSNHIQSFIEFPYCIKKNINATYNSIPPQNKGNYFDFCKSCKYKIRGLCKGIH